jgi:hypothetical protein
LRKNLFLLLRLLLLLRRVRRFWSKRIANFDLFFKVIIVFSCCLCLVVSLLLSSLWTRHHTGNTLRATSIDKGTLRAHSSCCSNLGLRACWLLHTRLEVVHVSRRLIYLLNGRNFISSFGSFRDIKVTCRLYLIKISKSIIHIDHGRVMFRIYQHRFHLILWASLVSFSYCWLPLYLQE